MAQVMDYQKELSAKLERTKAVEAMTQKAAEKGTSLMRKMELNNETL